MMNPQDKSKTELKFFLRPASLLSIPAFVSLFVCLCFLEMMLLFSVHQGSSSLLSNQWDNI